MPTDLRRPSGNWKLILNIEFIFRSEGSILNTRARYLDLLAQKHMEAETSKRKSIEKYHLY